MISEGLAGDGEAANVGPVLAVRNAQLEETRRTKLAHERAALAVEIVGVAAGKIGRAPDFELAGKLAVALLEKGPGEDAGVDHQSPRNTGWCLPLKAW